MVVYVANTNRSPLDDVNEPCTAVIAKKKNRHAKFLYNTHLISAPTWLKWFNLFKNSFLSESISKKEDFEGF